MNEEHKIRDVVDAVTGVAKAVPVYQDLVQPAAKEVGKALKTVAKAVHIALAPVSAFVWAYDQIKDFVSTEVTERLSNVPREDLVTPRPNVAGPALEALRYCGSEPSLSDLYANLIASAMDKSTAQGAHPAFVEIIRQLTPDEAKLVRLFLAAKPLPIINLRWEYKPDQDGKTGGVDVLVHHSHLGALAGCEFPDMTPMYIDNLCRLGLAEVPDYWQYTVPGVYDALEEDGVVTSAKASIESDEGKQVVVTRHGLRITELGKQFTQICVARKK